MIFFGDSICVGQWISIEETWVTRVASECPSPFVVHNRSINGNTSRQALERMHFDVLSHRPYAVVIQFGLNDANIWSDDKGHPRVSENSYIANIEEMIDRCRHHGVELIVLNSNHPTTRTHQILPNSTQTFEERNEAYYQRLKSFALSKKDVYFFDINKIFKEACKSQKSNCLSEYLLNDEIHLSKKGHDLYFKSFKEFIVPNLLKSHPISPSLAVI